MNCHRIAERFRGRQIVLLTEDAQERGNTSEQSQSRSFSFSLARSL